MRNLESSNHHKAPSCREIPYYRDAISDELLSHLKKESRPVAGVQDLFEVGNGGGLESTESLRFLCELYDLTKAQLSAILNQRILDRQFIDQRTEACFKLNQSLRIDYLDPRYETVIGHEDGKGRIVMGPKNSYYCQSGYGKPIAPIPDYLTAPHVTLFGPPDDAKMSINAMNCWHRQIKSEPSIVSDLLKNSKALPKWGADDEDSKTPLREDLVSASHNLTHCLLGDLQFTDVKTNKKYELAKDHLAHPIKRFPGLALPSLFLLYRDNPMPLHLYDYALHLFTNWNNPKALAFYVPKLENEEEAKYIHDMIEASERLIQKLHPEYVLGTVRLFIVLENPRAIFRANEIMDELYPYFCGASLGWHDYLASTARIFKNDSNYRIPVKADPNIVIQYIKASHDLLAEVVGPRGGIKIGGMYGVLPSDGDLFSPSFQVTIKGFIKDVVSQLKRNLSGFWIAHPDFVRFGLAFVEAWEHFKKNDKSKLEKLVTSLLEPKYHKEILDFVFGSDIESLDRNHPMYPRLLIVADLKESKFIANNHPEEIRYNVFQSLQYLADWLSGNGCVALPAQIDGVSIRVMDDLATAERSRWEVWHELQHGRFSYEEFLKIVHEEMLFIRKDLSNSEKIVQVKWDERTSKWYPIALKIMIHLMTSKNPVEFAPELLLPFTVESIRNSEDPWKVVTNIEPHKYALEPRLARFNEFFEICGHKKFAGRLADDLILDLATAQKIIANFELEDIIEAAKFHGNIGESKKTLDERASREQARVFQEDEAVKVKLQRLGADYLQKFGVKFLISAQGKSGVELLSELEKRLNNSPAVEIENSRKALWEISLKRLNDHPTLHLQKKISERVQKFSITGAQISLSTGVGSTINGPSASASTQTLNFGFHHRNDNNPAPAHKDSWFELASLSKTLASCFAMEYFKAKNISLQTSVNSLFAKTKSKFRVTSFDDAHPEWGDQVTLMQLMTHRALNMHYLNGFPANQKMPTSGQLLLENDQFGYIKVGVSTRPGTLFQYSGGGFLVLEYLIESLEEKPIQTLTAVFFKDLGLDHLSFDQTTLSQQQYAHGYDDDGKEVPGTRKMFPAFGAGAMGTAQDVSRFLVKLTKAYHDMQGCGPISHDTAVRMLGTKDSSSRKFMGVDMGIGVFVCEAGLNRLAIHQGANDGFRCLFVHCFSGPDRDKGFVILCNADYHGVIFITEVAKLILAELKMEGVSLGRLANNFDPKCFPPAEVVNQAYKKLIFEAFDPDLPEEIILKGPRDPLADINLAVGGKLIEVTNQGFARAENLLSPYLPTFDPELYGRQGKIMDSWESVRHNPLPHDHLIFEMKKPASISYVSFSTKYHHGNQPLAVTVEGQTTESGDWIEVAPRTELDGHALKYVKSNNRKEIFSRIKVSIIPDGGLSRLGLFGENLPVEERSKNAIFSDPIPQSVKPLTPKYKFSSEDIARNWSALKAGEDVDLANSAYGASIASATNEHYSPASQVISPFAPINMFDGSESARSRSKGHFEEIIVSLAKSRRIYRIEIDFSYFRNNSPLEIQIQGKTPQAWVTLFTKENVKAYAGNKMSFAVTEEKELSQIKFTLFPDGGMNRVHVIGKV